MWKGLHIGCSCSRTSSLCALYLSQHFSQGMQSEVDPWIDFNLKTEFRPTFCNWIKGLSCRRRYRRRASGFEIKSIKPFRVDGRFSPKRKNSFLPPGNNAKVFQLNDWTLWNFYENGMAVECNVPFSFRFRSIAIYFVFTLILVWLLFNCLRQKEGRCLLQDVCLSDFIERQEIKGKRSLCLSLSRL